MRSMTQLEWEENLRGGEGQRMADGKAGEEDGECRNSVYPLRVGSRAFSGNCPLIKSLLLINLAEHSFCLSTQHSMRVTLAHPFFYGNPSNFLSPHSRHFIYKALIIEAQISSKALKTLKSSQ